MTLQAWKYKTSDPKSARNLSPLFAQAVSERRATLSLIQLVQTLEPLWTLKLHNLKTSSLFSLSSEVGKFCCPFLVTGVELQNNLSTGTNLFYQLTFPECFQYFFMFLHFFLEERKPPQRDALLPVQSV